MSSAAAADDDDDSHSTTCGGFYVPPPDDDDPRPSEEDIERAGGRMGMMMRGAAGFNNHNSSGSSASGITPDKVFSLIHSRRKNDQTGFGGKAAIMTIRIQLQGLEPPIWRLVKVPSSLSLHEFHSKVIVPAMGWAASGSSHGYMFMLKPFVEYGNDKKSIKWGVGLGPIDCMTYRDTLFPQKAYGLSLCDTLRKDLIVGDLFYREENNQNSLCSEALYVYDLGDFFAHSLTLENYEGFDDEQQAAKSVSKTTAELLDGERACPPEDCGGNWRYAHMLSILSNPSHEEYQETLDNVYNSSNYTHLAAQRRGRSGQQGLFDPARFDLSLAQERIKLSFQSASKQRKRSSNEVKASCSCPLCRRLRRGPEDESASQQQSPLMMMGLDMGAPCSAAARRQTQNLAMGKKEYFGKNEDGNRCCNFCLDRECPYSPRFQKCMKCQRRFYCSKECQEEDWDFRHKNICKEIAANHCCHACGKIDENKNFPACSRCKAVYYCSRDCQRKDWGKGGRHRKECQSTKKTKSDG